MSSWNKLRFPHVRKFLSRHHIICSCWEAHCIYPRGHTYFTLEQIAHATSQFRALEKKIFLRLFLRAVRNFISPSCCSLGKYNLRRQRFNYWEATVEMHLQQLKRRGCDADYIQSARWNYMYNINIMCTHPGTARADWEWPIYLESRSARVALLFHAGLCEGT
jgi:hypothetical protein